MRVIDSRRLTGANLQYAGPGAVVEVVFDTDDSVDELLRLWMAQWEAYEGRLPFQVGERVIRRFAGGAALFCAAPIDALYATVELNEGIVQCIARGERLFDDLQCQELLTLCVQQYDAEKDPSLLALESAANEHDVPFLWDDDAVSLGFGRYSQTWTRSECPHPNDLDWSQFRGIPVVLITGTNGKTTTARLLARMVQEAGCTVGNSSTDGLSVNGVLVEEGDWTGPGAARSVLRHPAVEFAVLESARGGLLRRGLGVTQCDAAIVTNVADDHLGDYGVLDLTEMARAKGVVYRVVSEGGTRVFNVDNAYSLAQYQTYGGPAVFVSVQGRDAVRPYLNADESAVFLDGSSIYLSKGGDTIHLTDLDKVALARGGAALHDVSNALGAIALAWSTGIDLESVCATLERFGRDWADNPGRGRLVELDGVRVLLDFGHNPHGVDAVLAMARRLTTVDGRIGVCFAQAGDRSDRDFRALAETVARHAPDKVYLRDLPDTYHRGRTPESMAELLRSGLADSETPPKDVERVPDELTALTSGMHWARPGDLLVHLVHLERESVEDWLRSRGGSPC